MIGKSHSGSGFGGLTRYLLYGKKSDPKPDRVEWTSTRELALEDPKEAALLMRMTAAQGRTDEPVHHLSISLAPGEHLSPEQWEKVVDRTLEDLGLDGHQVLVVAHRDTDHEHIHLMVNLSPKCTAAPAPPPMPPGTPLIPPESPPVAVLPILDPPAKRGVIPCPS